MILNRQNVNTKVNNVTMYGSEDTAPTEQSSTYAGNTSGMMGQPAGDYNYKISHNTGRYW